VLTLDDPQKTSICDTCHNSLNDEIHRIVIFECPKNIPKIKRFHFFFPCWDFLYVVQQYPMLRIKHAGFSCSEKAHSKINQEFMKRNSEFWF
jgi:hypothetical protein